MEIKRYTTYEAGMSCESTRGEFVLYEDHLAIVEELKKKIAAAYSRGKSDGKDSGYSWRV